MIVLRSDVMVMFESHLIVISIVVVNINFALVYAMDHNIALGVYRNVFEAVFIKTIVSFLVCFDIQDKVFSLFVQFEGARYRWTAVVQNLMREYAE